MHYSMKVVYYIFTSSPGVVRIPFWTNPRSQVFFRKLVFFICGDPKNLIWPKQSQLGGHPSTTFWSEQQFRRWKFPKQPFLGNSVLDNSNNKMKKNWFSQKTWVLGCPKLDFDYPRGTCENVVYHFHGTIQTIITSYLRPVASHFKLIFS